jgi:hypothetical protein
MRALIAATGVLLLAGCGGGAAQPGGAKRSDRLVDFSQKPPYVNALDIDPATGDFLFTTNRRFFRIDAATDGGRRWRPIADGQGIRLARPARDALYRAGKDGTVERSSGPERLDLALSDGAIVGTQDGGRHWKTTFRP